MLVSLILARFSRREISVKRRLMEAGMRAPPRRTPREFYGSTVMHVAPALEYPGEDPVLRPIHPWMAVGSGASALLCVATRAVICFATEKNIRNKTVQDPHLGFFLCPPPPRHFVNSARLYGPAGQLFRAHYGPPCPTMSGQSNKLTCNPMQHLIKVRGR